MSRVVVTGGAGFIGSHLVDTLVRTCQVTVMDNFQSGKKENLIRVMDEITLVNGDIRDKDAVFNIVKDADLVFHLAANASVPYSIEHPRQDFETNALGTFNVLEACCRREVEKVVIASTAAVYGEPVNIPMDENHPLNPVSPYGASKLAGEKIGAVFSRVYGLSFAAVRIFNTFGPRQRKYVMYDLLQKLKKNSRRLEVLGTGDQVRDFLYVADMVNALLLVAEKGEGVYNVAGGNPTSIREVAELICSRVAPQAQVYYTGASWEGDINALTADIKKISKLGFSPEVSLQEGVGYLVDWFNEQ